MPTREIDPGIKVTRVTGDEIFRQYTRTSCDIISGPDDPRLEDDERKAMLIERKERHDTYTFTLEDMLKASTDPTYFPPGVPDSESLPNSDNSPHVSAHGTIFLLLDPVMLGEKVFVLVLADIAEMNLAEFEASKYNDPAPRAMVEGIRQFAFEKLAARGLDILSQAAYDGENNRSNVARIGRIITTMPWDSAEFCDRLMHLIADMDEYELEDLQAICVRMLEYVQGRVDLTDDITVRREATPQ